MHYGERQNEDHLFSSLYSVTVKHVVTVSSRWGEGVELMRTNTVCHSRQNSPLFVHVTGSHLSSLSPQDALPRNSLCHETKTQLSSLWLTSQSPLSFTPTHDRAV